MTDTVVSRDVIGEREKNLDWKIICCVRKYLDENIQSLGDDLLDLE